MLMTINTKASFDRRVRFKPDQDNRQEAVERIIWGLNDIVLERREANELSKLMAYAEQASFEDPYYELMWYTFWLGVKASSEILHNDHAGWDCFAKALGYSFFWQLSDQHARLSENATYSDPMSGGDESLFYWCLAVASCPEKIVRPWAHYFYNMLSQKGIYNDVGDYDVAELFWVLLKCYCEKRWINHSDLTKELGEDILPMLEAIGTPNWETALMDYCDFRLSRSYEYESIRAKKATSLSWFFGRQWHAVFPLELIALKAIYEHQTGELLNLKVEHPLLQTPLMNPPKFDVLPEDDLLKRLSTKSAQYYGNNWQPFVLLDLMKR